MPGRRSTRASKAAEAKDAGEMDTTKDAPAGEASKAGTMSTTPSEAAREVKEARDTKEQKNKESSEKQPQEQETTTSQAADQAQAQPTRRQQKSKKNKKPKQRQQQQKKGTSNKANKSQGKGSGADASKTNRRNQKKTNKKKPPPPTASVIILSEDHLLAKLQELADGENLQELQVTLLKAFAQPHHEASLLSSLRTVPFQTAVALLQQCTEALRLMFDASPKELKALAGTKTPPRLAYAITFVNTLIDAHLAGLLTDVACESMLRDLASLVAQYEDLCLQMHQMDGMLHHLRREQRLRGPLSRKGKKGAQTREQQKKQAKGNKKQQKQSQRKKDEKTHVSITETAVQHVTRTYTMETLELV